MRGALDVNLIFSGCFDFDSRQVEKKFLSTMVLQNSGRFKAEKEPENLAK